MILSPVLAELSWLEHAFGTIAAPLSQEHDVSLKQIHSDIVLLAGHSAGCAGEGDGLLTNLAGRAISIRTADCYPILIADVKTRSVAAIHAGWRGTAARIVVRAIEKMHREFGAQPSDLRAAVGPGIGECCYEVGAEVAARFGKSGRSQINLALENRRQLIEVGVSERHISVEGSCTYCNADAFHSFRRQGDAAGRMISFIKRLD